MKKNLKKIIMTSSIASIGLVSSASIFGAINNNNSTNIISKSMNNATQQKSITFNGKTYNSIEEAIVEYEKTNVSVESYIGDFLGASVSGSNYTKIYLDKNVVHKNDYSKIKTAYLTSYGKSTMDVNESKKSYVEQPTAAYKDQYGNIFYTERDAINSNAKTLAFGSISYYEINDYSKSESNPRKVNINPMNKNDLLELKKLAILNIGKKNSSFAINYLYANENPYGSGTTRYERPQTANSYISLDENKPSTKDKILYSITFNGIPLFKFDHD